MCGRGGESLSNLPLKPHINIPRTVYAEGLSNFFKSIFSFLQMQILTTAQGRKEFFISLFCFS